MSVSGLCELCDTGRVHDGCDRCGRLVCRDHYDVETGLCTECAAEVGRPSRPTGRPKDMPDGVDTYRF